MVTVSDMNRSVEFYRDKLGMPMKFQSPDWTEFQTEGTTLLCMGEGRRSRHQKIARAAQEFARLDSALRTSIRPMRISFQRGFDLSCPRQSKKAGISNSPFVSIRTGSVFHSRKPCKNDYFEGAWRNGFERYSFAIACAP
jgi:hypothetical protein